MNYKKELLEYPFQKKEGKADASNIVISFTEMFRPTDKQIEDYNQDLKNYHKEYQDYLELKLKYLKYQALSFNLEFELWNDGNAVAEYIHICMQLPDGFIVIEEKDYPQFPISPGPPSLPSVFASFPWRNQYTPIIKTYNPKLLINNINRPKPILTKTTGYNIILDLPTLNHHQKINFPSYTFQFSSVEMRKTFQIKYSITVGNIPDIIYGMLTVKLD